MSKKIELAKTSEEKRLAEELLDKTRQDRILIPIAIARRALYFGKE